MKRPYCFILLVLIAIGLSAFDAPEEIDDCFLNFMGTKGLKAKSPDRLPEQNRVPRTVKTKDGDVDVSRTDAYRILYLNEKGAPFVNLKVEHSDPDKFGMDTTNLIANLQYLNANSATDVETSDIIRMSMNGFTIYGTSRNEIDRGAFLGTFVMFGKNNMVIYVYFENMKKEYRNFSSLKDYKKQRDRFLEEYTAHLGLCK